MSDVKETIIYNDTANEHWVKAYWRPAMGWVYMLIVLCDFILFPLISLLIPIFGKIFGLQLTYTPWQSLTLASGGFIHFTFAAVLGINSWTRGQEKLARLTTT